MQAITVKFPSDKMHFNVATLGPFLQHYRQDQRERSDGTMQKIKKEERERVQGKYDEGYVLCVHFVHESTYAP